MLDQLEDFRVGGEVQDDVELLVPTGRWLNRKWKLVEVGRSEVELDRFNIAGCPDVVPGAALWCTDERSGACRLNRQYYCSAGNTRTTRSGVKM